MKLTITAFQVDFGDGGKEYLTCADIERLNKGRGIPVEALIGVVLQPRENPDDSITPDNFRSNIAFINLLQGLMAENGEWMDDMRINAEALGNGVLYVIDEPSPKRVAGQEWIVHSDDLIGEFDIKDGEIVPGSYRRNPDFALVNEEGLFQLTDGIAKTVKVAIENLPDPDDPTPFVGLRANQLDRLGIANAMSSPRYWRPDTATNMYCHRRTCRASSVNIEDARFWIERRNRLA